MQQIAYMLQFGLQSGLYFLLVLLETQLFYELFPIDQVLGLIFAVVQQKIDLFGSQCDVEQSECLFEHQIGDFACFLDIDLVECLFQSFGTGSNQIFEIVDLSKLKITNFWHCSSIFSRSS